MGLTKAGLAAKYGEANKVYNDMQVSGNAAETVAQDGEKVRVKFAIPQGPRGEKGDTGARGPQGSDGYSPSASVTKSGRTTTIRIRDISGETTAQVLDGAGEWGQITGDIEDQEDLMEVISELGAKLAYDTTTDTLTLQDSNEEDLSSVQIQALSGLQFDIDEVTVDEQTTYYLVAQNRSGVEICRVELPATGGGGSTVRMTMRNTSGWETKGIPLGDSCSVSVYWTSLDGTESTGSGSLKLYINDVQKYAKTVPQGTWTMDIGDYFTAGTNVIRIQITDAASNVRSVSLTVTATDLKMESSFDDSTAYSSDITFQYTPYGTIMKTIYYILDGDTIGTYQTTDSGHSVSFTIDADLLDHGAHIFEAYCTATISGETIQSNTLRYSIIFVESGETDTIISSTFNESSIEQYYTLAIPYQVYNPSSLTAPVSILVNGTAYQTITVDRTKQTFSYAPEEYGSLVIAITSGGVTKSFTITVTESQIHVDPVSTDQALYLTAKGRSNNEASPGTWTYGSISATFSNFTFAKDGWLLDDDNATRLCVTGDARVTIPYLMFQNDFKASGKTIEFEISTSEVRNYESTIISCYSGGVGLRITPQKVILNSSEYEMSTQFKEDEHVRVGFVVEKSRENRLWYCYINGVISAAYQYTTTDSFSQATPVYISIGSNDATTSIYNIRVYDNDLSRTQMLNNWIADSSTGALKAQRYLRNQIFNEYGQITIASLPDYLPYLVCEGVASPQYKGDKKTISGYYVNKQDTTKNFTFDGAQANVQGTSSQYYARKNYKISFKGGFIDSEGVLHSTYEFTDGCIPEKEFTFKADVASSEGCNNVELVRLYNELCPWVTPPQEDDDRVRQGIDGFSICIFWDYKDGLGPQFIGKYNFNNDKGNETTFGFEDGDESWEILNNTSQRVIWKDDDFTGTAWLSDFEGRYPDGNTDPQNLQNLSTWLKSTMNNLTKFRNEAANYLELDSALFYYLFTELFLMVDSRAKNAFPTKFADANWGWFPYDFDTALGINNEGELVFDYNLEDIDTLPGGAEVFNGQQSVMWCNLRDAFGAELKALYQTLRSNGLSYEDVVERFENHQAVWGEAMFNEDSYFKYIQPLIDDGEGSYLAMCQGSKAEQRKWWLYNRFRYIDSKYETGLAASNYINFRAYAVSDAVVTPYADIYARAKYGSYDVKHRATRNVPITLECEAASLNDTECMIYSADQLKSCGDLSGFLVGYANFAAGTHLTEIILGSNASGYSNANLRSLYLGNNTLLTKLDVRNCPNLTMAVDISNCSNIEEVYFEGTSISGLNLPDSDTLETIHLPSTIATLKFVNKTKITDLVLPSYSNITTLWLDNYNAVVDPYTVISAMAQNSRVRVVGFSSTVSDESELYDFYDRLDTMKGLDEQGYEVEDAQVSGDFYIDEISYEAYIELTARRPYITIHYNRLGDPSTRIYLSRGARRLTVRNATTIREDCFRGFTNLQYVSVAGVDTVGDYAFYGTSCETYLPDVEIVGEYSFASTGIEEIDLPSAETLESYAFRDSDIEEFSEDTVTSVGTGAFYNCTSLETAEVPYATSIGTGAFRGDTSLSVLDIERAQTLNPNALNGCSSLTNVGLTANNVRTFGASSLANTGLTSPEIVDRGSPHAVTLGNSFLAGTTLPSSINIGTNNTISLESGALASHNFTAVSISKVGTIANASLPKSLTSFTSSGMTSMFKNSYMLTDTTYPLTSVDVGSSTITGTHTMDVTAFSKDANVNLASVYMRWTDQICQLTAAPVEANVPYNVIFYVPSSLLAAYNSNANWKTYGTFTKWKTPSYDSVFYHNFTSANEEFAYIDGVRYYKTNAGNCWIGLCFIGGNIRPILLGLAATDVAYKYGTTDVTSAGYITTESGNIYYSGIPASSNGIFNASGLLGTTWSSIIQDLSATSNSLVIRNDVTDSPLDVFDDSSANGRLILTTVANRYNDTRNYATPLAAATQFYNDTADSSCFRAIP